MEEDLAREILDLHLEAPLEQSEPDRRTVLDTAIEYGATVYDAVFISLCLSRGVTLDHGGENNHRLGSQTPRSY